MSEQCSSCSSGSCDNCGNADEKLNKTLSRIKHKIVVLSGKGGVGKSTVATNIAVALSLAGKRVGLLDVDIHGPSVPRLLSLKGEKPHVEKNYMEPLQWSSHLWVMSLGFMIPSDKDAVIWRGPVKMGLIRQFIEDVAWGDLDFLVVDCPPGTGDEPMSAMQLLGQDAQGIIVTTPQGVAIDDVRRSVTFCEQLGNPILGMVENMSGFVCPKCNEVMDIFPPGGGEALAHEMHVNFLGRIPIDPEIVRAGDEGFIYIKTHHESEAAKALGRIVKPILAMSGSLQDGTPAPTTSKPPTKGDTSTMKIAIPSANGLLCMHFGHCEQFAMVSIDEQNKTILGTEFLTPPPHEPGVLPKWVAEQGADLVITGGMGARAQSLFTEAGVKVLVGAKGGSPEELATAFMNGTLQTGQNICDH
ncbi:MAG: chromosome partitioning protein ParA [Deltaproteobacteria bacterium]|nr:MAG: chromosome partitioning protein ParA [Deltaproteobacteria bacterium]